MADWPLTALFALLPLARRGCPGVYQKVGRPGYDRLGVQRGFRKSPTDFLRKFKGSGTLIECFAPRGWADPFTASVARSGHAPNSTGLSRIGSSGYNGALNRERPTARSLAPSRRVPRSEMVFGSRE